MYNNIIELTVLQNIVQIYFKVLGRRHKYRRANKTSKFKRNGASIRSTPEFINIENGATISI